MQKGKVVRALRSAPVEHRICAALVMVVLWYVFEQVLHYETAAKGIEVFGLVPFADRAMGFLLGE